MAEVVVPAIASDGRVTDPEANDELGARAAVDSGSEEDLLTDSHASKQSGALHGSEDLDVLGDGKLAGASKQQGVVPGRTPARTTRELAVARQSQELWYVVEWADEGTFSEVKSKWFVDDPDPSVGQKVKVREGSRKKVFSGTVMKKGTKHEVTAFMKEKEEEDERMSEPEGSDNLDIFEVLDAAPKAKRRKKTKKMPHPADNEAKVAKQAATKARVGKNKAREQARERESEEIISKLGYNVLTQLGIPITSTSAPLPTTPPLQTYTGALLPTTTTSALHGRSTTTTISNTVPISSTSHSTIPVINQQPPDLSNMQLWDNYDYEEPYWMATPGQNEDMYEIIRDMKKDMAEMQASIDELKKSVKRKEKRASREARSDAAEVENPIAGSSTRMNTRVSNGVLGDPRSASRFEFPNITMAAVMEAENAATSPAKLAVNLLTALFTHEELSMGNCTKANREDIKLLDQAKIQAIRAHVNFKYPTNEEAKGKRWKDILTKSLNAKCRACRAKVTTSDN